MSSPVVKPFKMSDKNSISNEFCSFKISINQRILKKKIIMVSTKVLISTTVFNMDDNKKCFKNMKKN